jgi:hypothetical protein
MKALFFSLAAFFAVTPAFAQKFEFGLNGGIGFNTAPKIGNAFPAYISENEKPSSQSFTASAKGCYNYYKWQFGIESDVVNLSYSYTEHARHVYYPSYFKGYKGNDIYYPGGTTEVNLAAPAIPVKFFVNRVIKLNKFQLYYGISAGCVFVTNSKIVVPLVGNYYPASANVSGRGSSVGVRTGGTYFISKHVGINAELAADYMYLNIANVKYKLYSTPATFGIRYKL